MLSGWLQLWLQAQGCIIFLELISKPSGCEFPKDGPGVIYCPSTPRCLPRLTPPVVWKTPNQAGFCIHTSVVRASCLCCGLVLGHHERWCSQSATLQSSSNNYGRILAGLIFRQDLRDNSDPCVMILIVNIHLTRGGERLLSIGQV